jgi:TatD DNase family protein
MYFDSHCHLDHPLLNGDLPGLLASAGRAGVTGFLVPGVHPDGWPGIAALSRSYPEVSAAFGVHPMHAALLSPEVLRNLQDLSPLAAAIGEIGLDYALPSPSREVQQFAFRAQLKLAVQAGLPVLIHCRRAFRDLLVTLEEEGVSRAGGVMHAFSGSPETARACVRLGLHISLAGTVTYANAVRPPAVAAATPLERLLLETDAPDLAPEPHRGGVNLPHYLLETAARVAQIRGIGTEELARATTSNAARLFRLKGYPQYTLNKLPTST